jgi:tripartite-type tricarboxylate transporter receptor subunit TctC
VRLFHRMPGRLVRTVRLALCAVAAIALPLAGGSAHAQRFPERPLKLVVGFAPGGPADALARIAGQILSDGLGQPVIVENRAGAGGTIAATAVARAAPDGHTLLVGATSDVINPLARKDVAYRLEANFTAVALIASTPNVLVVHPSVPVGSVQELVAYARAHPGALNYGSAGVGTLSHLAAAFLAATAQLQVVHVPYKGTAAAQVDLLGGRLQFMFDSMLSAMANAKAGKVKALAVTSPQRWPNAPMLATMAESGFPGFDMMAWFGLLAPADTPRQIVSRLSDVLLKGLQAGETRQRIRGIGGEPGRLTPAEFGQYIRAENARWGKLFADAVVHIEE